MSDLEIVKALECCLRDDESYGADGCENCPLNQDNDCTNAVRKYSFDLINRLQKENKRLKKENRQFADIGKMYSEVKADAYKECIDMVKKKGVKVGVDEICIFEGTLNNLLKEMVGDNETIL